MDQTRAELAARLKASLARERTPAATYARRLAYEHMEGRTGPLPTPPRASRTPRPAPPDDGLWFSREERRREAAEAEHWARRRRAEAETTARDRLYRSLRDAYGSDAADRMMP